MLNVKTVITEAMQFTNDPSVPAHAVEGLGVFGAMALQAVLQAGAEPGFRCVRALTGYGDRLAPHRALRHRLLSALIEASVLAPVQTKRRLDDAFVNAKWGDESLEDVDWLVQWNGPTRGSLPHMLAEFLGSFESTPRTQEVLLETWLALGTAECLAFGEYALASHNLNPAIARTVAPSLQPLLAQLSIGHCCAVMWYATKNLASRFMRQGGTGTSWAGSELSRSIANHFNRGVMGAYPVRPFSRHSAVPLSTFANVFIWTSGLGDAYWMVPISEMALERARPIGSAAPTSS